MYFTNNISFMNNEKIPKITKETIINSNISCTFYTPLILKSSIPVICLGGSEGGIPDYWAELISQQGNFITCALGYFACNQRPSLLEDINLEYFLNAIEFIKKKYNTEKIIVIGMSRGGELALLLGSLYPNLFQKIIAIAPSSIINGGFPYPNHSAWLINNTIISFAGGLSNIKNITEKEDLNYAIKKKLIKSHSNTEQNPFIIADLFKARFEKYIIKLEEVSIKVENINCPLLLFSGEDDKIWPSHFYCNKIIERLLKYQSNIKNHHISYSEVGHGVLLAYDLPIWHRIGEFWCTLGGNPIKNKAANKDCLKKIIEFIEN